MYVVLLYVNQLGDIKQHKIRALHARLTDKKKLWLLLPHSRNKDSSGMVTVLINLHKTMGPFLIYAFAFYDYTLHVFSIQK